MKKKYQITELSHEDLVNLCSLLDGAPEMYLDYNQELYEKYKGDTFEDTLANILLDGGKIQFVDANCDMSDPTDCQEPAHNVKLHFCTQIHTELRAIVSDRTEVVNEHIIAGLINGNYRYGNDICVNGVTAKTIVEDIPFFTAIYDISLEDILRAMSDDEVIGYVNDFAEGNADMWCAFSVFQVAAFGEVVYG